MNFRSQSLKFILLALICTLFVSQACSRSAQEEELNLQSTLVAIELTKISLESQATPMPAQPIELDEADIQPPVVEPPPQPVQEPNVSYEGISFSFSPAIAASAIATTVPGQNMGEDFYAFETYPTYDEFSFNQYAVSDHFHVPRIFVYPIEEYRSISGFAQDQFNKLEAALVNRPGGSRMSDLPFLPLWPAAQLFSAQVSYFEFQNGSGVRFLTMFGQDIYPVDNHNLFYTYQGMTYDGRYYISVVMPITHAGLPEDSSDLIGDDYMAFYNNWDNYLSDTIRFLGEQPPDTYNPSILLLDEMIKSIFINR